MKTCAKCGIEIADDEVYIMNGEELCDDCSIILAMRSTTKKCDPIAVQSTITARKQSKEIGTEGLTSQQKDVYDFIKENEGATIAQLLDRFDMIEEELDLMLTTFRHMELCKGEKREDGVYMVVW